MTKKFDYFKAFEQQAEQACKAAEFLKDTLKSYDMHGLPVALEHMSKIESDADDINHVIRERLRIDFVTPLEREDIAEFSYSLDDVVDQIEDALMGFYMYHIETVNNDMLSMVDAIYTAAYTMREAVHKLPTFRKANNELVPLLIKVGDAESAGDRLLLDAMHRVFDSASGYTAVETIALSRIFMTLEKALDSLERCASCMEAMIMTNL